uniref:Uncharacterized protein n=1 Tax=Acrobeloides nanus TaxID=290746 RepID=A0A914E7D6_9BILA
MKPSVDQLVAEALPDIPNNLKPQAMNAAQLFHGSVAWSVATENTGCDTANKLIQDPSNATAILNSGGANVGSSLVANGATQKLMG